MNCNLSNHRKSILWAIICFIFYVFIEKIIEQTNVHNTTIIFILGIIVAGLSNDIANYLLKK